jgi:hypothetical protein
VLAEAVPISPSAASPVAAAANAVTRRSACLMRWPRIVRTV